DHRAAHGPVPRHRAARPRGRRAHPHRRCRRRGAAAADGVTRPHPSTIDTEEHMSRHEYDDELRSERGYVDGLYARLDAERARVRDRYTTALRGDGGSPMEREFEVRALAKEAKRLDIADNGLCFGRLDAVTGEHSYIGRIGLFDEANDFEPLLLDWRAPAARPFYVATAASPENMRRRRQFHSR